jgi:uridine kinase
MSELLVKLGKSAVEITEMLVQVYGDNAMKKTAVYKWVASFLREEQISLMKRDQYGQQ